MCCKLKYIWKLRNRQDTFLHKSFIFPRLNFSSLLPASLPQVGLPRWETGDYSQHLNVPLCSSFLFPTFFFFYSIVGHLHVLHSVRINFLQHASSMGHSLDIYSNGVVSTGCSEIFSHLHRLLSMSGQSSLSWGLKRWQFLQKMSTCSSTSCSLDICSGVGISMI